MNTDFAAATVSVRLCVPDDQAMHLPARCCAPIALPHGVPVPRQGDVLYLGPTSAWGVMMVIHEWHLPDTLNIEVWLDHVGTTIRVAAEAHKGVLQ